MAQGTPTSPSKNDDSSAAESGTTHPGSLDDEYENFEIIVDAVDSDDSMSDPFEDAQEDATTPLVNGVRVPSLTFQGPCNEVQLPARFCKRSFTSPTHTEDVCDHSDDITTALSWLRQEIKKLKQQDKALLRQFLDLRATIHGYLAQGPRPRVRSYNCASDESDTMPSPTAQSALLSPYDIFRQVEFRPRTVSLLSPKDAYHLPNRDVVEES